MSDIVLDSSAVLALLKNESGADVVEQNLADAWISSVNLAEVVGRLSLDGLEPLEIQTTLDELALTVIPLSAAQAFETGAMTPRTAPKGLSLGDRACLTLAQQEGLPVLTADRNWMGLDLGIDVRLIR